MNTIVITIIEGLPSPELTFRVPNDGLAKFKRTLENYGYVDRGNSIVSSDDRIEVFMVGETCQSLRDSDIYNILTA